MQYSYDKQIEIHGDYNLLNKENQALTDIIKGLEKQLQMMKREVIEVRTKHETCQMDNEKLRNSGEDQMLLISEANMIKREQLYIIRSYKEKI